MGQEQPTRIIFFGTPEFAAIGLRALAANPAMQVGLVVTQPDKPAGRGGKLMMSPVKILANELGIPVLQPPRIRKIEADFLREVAQHGMFDVGVVIAFGQILPEQTLAIGTCGSVNVHASLLPRWRGAAPIHRAMLAGDAETGICLMKMDAGLDTGAVYSRAVVAIEATDTLGSLHDKLARQGAALLERDLGAIARGALPAEPQPEAGVTYADKVTSADSVIAWTAPASYIARQVRAFNPFPGAFTSCQGKRLKIFAAQALKHAPDQSANTTPGTVLRKDGKSLEVACGEGVLSIAEVQLEGKSRMPVDAFLRGNIVPEVLGDS